MKQCDHCGDLFVPRVPIQRFCSPRCSGRTHEAARAKRRRATPEGRAKERVKELRREARRRGKCFRCGVIVMATRSRDLAPRFCQRCDGRGKALRDCTCLDCGANFMARGPAKRCESCRSRDSREQLRVCRCGNVFWTSSQSKTFCSRTCPSAWMGTTGKALGIDRARYEELVEKQSGRCAICGDEPRRRLDIDHNHDTDVVRGLLCGLCNRGLGLFRDDPQRLLAAANYLAGAGSNRFDPAG